MRLDEEILQRQHLAIGTLLLRQCLAEHILWLGGLVRFGVPPRDFGPSCGGRFG